MLAGFTDFTVWRVYQQGVAWCSSVPLIFSKWEAEAGVNHIPMLLNIHHLQRRRNVFPSFVLTTLMSFKHFQWNSSKQSYVYIFCGWWKAFGSQPLPFGKMEHSTSKNRNLQKLDVQLSCTVMCEPASNCLGIIQPSRKAADDFIRTAAPLCIVALQ